MDTIAWAVNKRRCPDAEVPQDFLGREAIERVRGFHASFPEYAETPLRRLDGLAGRLGVGEVYVKDESLRFSLNAFKVLGASYAIARFIGQQLPGGDVPDYRTLVSPAAAGRLGPLTFVTATDGNHGRGVAWTARRLGHRAVVYMPKGSAAVRLANIRAEGAEASVTGLNYDGAVRLAAENAARFGWVVVQDTAWEGYEDIPRWIMQGYGTMAAEAAAQLERLGAGRPTHVFLQAGVGSFAAAVQGYFAALWGAERPRTAVVEPSLADCLYRSALANDGEPRTVTGDMPTMMAGLACGEPNRIGWEILRDCADMFFSCPDWVAAEGMRLLGSPRAGDARVVSGESGAVTAGLLTALMRLDDCRPARAELGLGRDSRVLLFSTEGDTDPANYRQVVSGGLHPWPGPANSSRT